MISYVFRHADGKLILEAGDTRHSRLRGQRPYRKLFLNNRTQSNGSRLSDTLLQNET